MMPTVKTQDDYDAEYDLQTLERAKEIRGTPERLARAKDFAKRKMTALKEIAGGDVPRETEGMLKDGFRKLDK